MDMFGFKGLIQTEDHVTVLKIENFSCGNNDPQEETFIPTLFNGLYAFSVSVFPNGSCPIFAGHVSLLIKSSMTPNQDLTSMGSSNSMSCTASFIDVFGERRYSQSFGMENLIFPDSYIPGLERFLKRSTLLSQKEELLPRDVLTMRFEFTLTSNQELAMLSKITEFLPSLLVEPSNLRRRETDNNDVCDFAEIFRDIKEKNDDECSGFACAKPLDDYLKPNVTDSAQASFSEMHKIIDAAQKFDFGIYKKNEGTQAVINEIYAENENLTLESAIYKRKGSTHSSGTELQKDNSDKTRCIGILNENEANIAQYNVIDKAVEEVKMSEYEAAKKENKLFETHNVERFNQQRMSTKTAAVGEQCSELKPVKMSKDFNEKMRQLEQTGDETTKNIIIVVNGHRIFQKSGQSHKNRVDFNLTTDEELYKMFYSIESLNDENSKPIYRMHGTVPFFKNLMDRDESSFFYVPNNEKNNLQEDAEDLGPSETTCDIKTLRNDNGIADSKELKNSQHFSDKNVSMSSEKFGFDSSETHMESINFSEGSKSMITSEKSTDKEIEKKNRERDSSNEEKNNNEDKYDFLIQTADNVTILIPFEENKETFGSKLLSVSTVFQNMLRHPMKERSERRVEMSDATSRTVNNILSYVDSGKFSDIPLPDAYDLYEAADKYAVKNLMKACADFMAYFPIRENVWSMVKLAELHCDEYLLELAESVQKLVFRLEQISSKNKKDYLEMIGELLKDPEVSLDSKETQSDFFAQDFNFYQ